MGGGGGVWRLFVWLLTMVSVKLLGTNVAVTFIHEIIGMQKNITVGA